MKKLSSLLKDLLKVAPKFIQKDTCEVPTAFWIVPFTKLRHVNSRSPDTAEENVGASFSAGLWVEEQDHLSQGRAWKPHLMMILFTPLTNEAEWEGCPIRTWIFYPVHSRPISQFQNLNVQMTWKEPPCSLWTWTLPKATETYEPETVLRTIRGECGWPSTANGNSKTYLLQIDISVSVLNWHYTVWGNSSILSCC